MLYFIFKNCQYKKWKKYEKTFDFISKFAIMAMSDERRRFFRKKKNSKITSLIKIQKSSLTSISFTLQERSGTNAEVRGQI